MGRARLNLQLISKEKPRFLTFKKRKQGLFTKLHQLTTLCDVSACIIIYGPKQEHGATEPEIWPQNPDEVRRIIGLYEGKNRGKGSSSSNNKTSTFGLSDFFHERKRKIEEEIVRLRRKNIEAKYPTRLESLSFLTEGELRNFSALLKNKADIVKSRIDFLKGNRRGGLMDQNQSHDFRVFSESTAAMGDPGVFQNPMAVEQYYGPRVAQPLTPLYMQCAGMSAVAPVQLYMQCFGMGREAPPQMQFPAMESNYEINNDGGLEDIVLQGTTVMGGLTPPLPLQCAGMDGVAPPLYLQCVGMDGVAPPPPLQFPWSGEFNYENDDGSGLEDICFQYI